MFMFNNWVYIHRHVHLDLFTCRCTDVHGNTGKRLFAQTQPDRNKWCDAQHQCLKAPIPKMIGLAELGSVASAESSMTFEAAQSLADKVDQLAAEATEINAVVGRLLGINKKAQIVQQVNMATWQ